MAGFFTSTAGRVLIALLAPVAWGLLSAWLFERLWPQGKRGVSPNAPPRRRRRGQP